MTLIKEYAEKPSFEPLYKGKITFSSIWMGVELELELKNSQEVELRAQNIIDILGDFVILKKDATVKRGFEICSRPASLEFHKERWAKFFDQIGDNFQTFYIEQDKKTDKEITKNNCGMHVHVNRAPLSDLQIGKMLYFIHKKDNLSFIKSIAGRESNEYGNYTAPLHLRDAKFDRYVKFSRGLGINLHNYNTVEVRIFKSTTQFDIFMKNLEFCDALVNYTLPSKTSIDDSTDQKKFTTFIEENEKLYPYLLTFLKGIK